MSIFKKLFFVLWGVLILIITQDAVMASGENDFIKELLAVKYSTLKLSEDYNNMAIAKLDTDIEDENGQIVGKLPKDSAADIVNILYDTSKYEIVSGDVIGYVSVASVLTDKMAEFRAVDILNEKAQLKGKALVYDYEIFKVNKDGDKSFAINVEGVLDKGVPFVDEATDKEKLSTDDMENENKEAEEKIEKEEEKTEDIRAEKRMDYTKKELKLLAAIIYCEAGHQSYDGKLAVANVVLNRVENDNFANSIKTVIYSRNQFSPAKNGKLDRAIKRGVPKSCYDAAKAALHGENNVKGYLYFDGKPHKRGYKKIDAHYFWKTPW